MLLGDFVGGSAVVIGARAVLHSSYSREVESAADRYGVDLMNRAGGDQRALGAVLNRIAGANHPGHGNFARSPRYASARKADKRSRGGVCAAATLAGAVRMGRAEAYLHGPMRRAYFARRIQADPTSRLAIWARRVAVFSDRRGAARHRDRARRHSGDHPLARGVRRRACCSPAIAMRARARRVRGDLARGAVRASAWRSARSSSASRSSPIRPISAPRPIACRRSTDITTDPIDPPRFEAIARLRPREANPIALCRPARRRIAEGGLSERRAADRVGDAAGRLRRRHAGRSPSTSGASSMRARRWPAAATAASRRSRARRSSASATTWCCASARIPTARASISARPRAMAGTTSAPTRRASSRSPRRSTTRSDDATPEKPPEQLKKAKKGDPKAAKTAPADKRR